MNCNQCGQDISVVERDFREASRDMNNKQYIFELHRKHGGSICIECFMEIVLMFQKI